MRKRNIVIIVVFAAAIAAVSLLPGNAKKAGIVPGAQGSGAAGGPAGAPGSAANAPAGNAGAASASGTAALAQDTVYSVRTAVVEKRTLQDYLETNGDVITATSVQVYPDVAGKLASITIVLGSKVTKGQVVAEVDPSKPGSTYSLSPVHAPISGTVTAVSFQTGSTVSTSSALATVGVMDELQVSALIPERDVAVLKRGLNADVTLEAYPGVVFKATVSEVSPVVDSTSRTKEIRLGLDAKDSRVNVGMFAKVKLYTTAYANRLTVPDSAINSNFDERYVFVAKDDGTVSRRAVTVGASVDATSEIKSGLEEGERVVIQGAQVLSDGAKYRDIDAKKGGQS